MGLETGDYISDLVDTNPLGTDPKNQGDDRLIKKCVQQSFPLVDGAVSIATLNFVDRSADETITGSWTFDQQLNSPGLRPLIDNGGLELFGDANDVTGDRSYIILYGKDNAQNGAIHYSCGLASTHIWDVGSNEIARIDQSNLRLTNAPQFIDAATRRDYVDTEITNASAANNQYTDDSIAALEVLGWGADPVGQLVQDSQRDAGYLPGGLQRQCLQRAGVRPGYSWQLQQRRSCARRDGIPDHDRV
jgi:hypothetical protein